jgi:hypothetical protein
LDYQNFRAGNASGARGEVASLCASKAAVPYRASGRKAQRPRLVPLIGAVAARRDFFRLLLEESYFLGCEIIFFGGNSYFFGGRYDFLFFFVLHFWLSPSDVGL